ncbi:unannotated protein [freshwater metagenome]|uniref:Unannotated protein n=1 Tax=freshwater metagenome TaxID=449393 RepID=A0A6J6W6R4_9ZZZZ|nr:hypothetical protein [Actinomycetota bacterium]
MKRRLISVLVFTLSFTASTAALAAGPIASRDMVDVLKFRPVTWSAGNWYAWPSFTRYPSPNNAADYTGWLVLPPCDGKIKNDCISSLEYRRGNEDWRKGTFKRYVPFSAKYIALSGNQVSKSAEPLHNFPDSAMSGLWEFPGLSHPGGSEFMFNTSIYGEFGGMRNPNGTDAKFQYDGVGPIMRLDPVSIIEDSAEYQVSDPERKYGDWCSNGEAIRTCIRKFDFPQGVEFRANLNFKLAKQFWNNYNWIIGYGSHPSITVSNNSDGSTNYSFAAAPVYRTFPVSLIPKTEQGFTDWLDSQRAFLKESSPNQEFKEDGSPAAFIIWRDFRVSQGIDGEQPGAFSAWPFLEKYLAPELAVEVAEWGFRKAQPTGEDYNWVSRCSTSGEISGLSATNASIAKPGPPHWSEKNQSLEFQIAAPHAFGNGTPIVGQYYLSLSKKVADCLWGTNVANAKATVSVTYPDGIVEIINSTMKTSATAVDFSITGFHYSVDQFSIKLETQAIKPPTFSEKPKEIIKTIICVKGKSVKRIPGVAPKCPSGYKLKK